MKLFIEAILGLAFVHSVLANAPKMLWTDCPDDSSCNKCLDVAFESENDIACLHQKYPENSCVFEGALMNGDDSMIVVSSDECFEHGTMENIQVAMTDSRSPGMTLFEVNAVAGISTAPFFGNGGDGEQVDSFRETHIDSGLPPKNKTTKSPPYPAGGFKLNVAVRYDSLFASNFPSNTVAKIEGIMALVQPMYFWNSLDAHMCITVQSILPYNGPITTNDLDPLVTYVSQTEPEDADAFVYITHLTPPSGGGSFTVGIAWVGSVCYTNNLSVNGGTNNGKGFRVSINSWVSSDLGLSRTIAHEMGHNLGMRHDFDPNPGDDRFCTTDGSSCTDDGGVMDYFQPVTNKWTCCSNADFKIVYDNWQPFCLEACSGGPPSTTTPIGPTTAPPTGCGSPNFYQDGYCDDNNNTPECNYDGGDCCTPHERPDSWNDFCSKCECLEPTTTTKATTITTTPGCSPSFLGDGYCDDCHNTVEGNYDGGDCCPPHEKPDSWNNFCSKCECLQPACEDEWPSKKCKKCNAKKCKKSGKCKKNCKNTCNLCGGEEPCEDEKSSKFCKKALKKGKCNKVWKKCKKTCDRCDSRYLG